MSRHDRYRPALKASEVWRDKARYEAQRDGIDLDRKPAPCVRIDPASGKVIGVVEVTCEQPCLTGSRSPKS